MNMVEKVAWAIAKFGWSVENPVFDDWFNRPEIQEAYLEQARVAIEAMREPTMPMLQAGLKAAGAASLPDDVWPVMIDKALEEQ